MISASEAISIMIRTILRRWCDHHMVDVSHKFGFDGDTLLFIYGFLCQLTIVHWGMENLDGLSQLISVSWCFFLFLFLHLFSVFAFSRPDMKTGFSRWIYPPTRFPRHSCCSEPVRFWGMAVRWICSSGEWFEWSSETGAAHVEGASEAWQVTKMNKSIPVLQVFFGRNHSILLGTPMIHEFNGCS